MHTSLLSGVHHNPAGLRPVPAATLLFMNPYSLGLWQRQLRRNNTMTFPGLKATGESML